MVNRRHGSAARISGPVRLWGRHAVIAAIANPDRRLRHVWGTREALGALELPPRLPISFSDAAGLARLIPPDAPHQGLVAEVDPLDDIWLEDLLDAHAEADAPLLVLDQVTDPHNVGAIMRSAAAFGAIAMVTQDRHAPPESGALAKAASGALETVPWVRVVNLARALAIIAERGYWRVGLAGESTTVIGMALAKRRNALVLGAEGSGLRPNVADHCDVLARLPIHPRMESLNVSNAAAVALYATAQASGPWA